MKQRLEIVMTAILVVCAIVIVGLLVERRLGHASGPEDVTDEQRQEFLRMANVTGPRTARLKIIEFGDYQCRWCRVMEPNLKRVRGKYAPDVSVAYLHLPSPSRRLSFLAAVASECAARQGSFDDYHAEVFDRQRELSERVLVDIAADLEISDTTEFRECLRGERTASVVERHIRAAKELELSATPTFIVGNKIISGAFSFEELDALVAERLSSE